MRRDTSRDGSSAGFESSVETVGTVLCEWIDLREATLSPSTIDVYRQTIRHRLVPALGTITVGELTARQLDHYYATLHEEGLASGTIQAPRDLAWGIGAVSAMGTDRAERRR